MNTIEITTPVNTTINVSLKRQGLWILAGLVFALLLGGCTSKTEDSTYYPALDILSQTYSSALKLRTQNGWTWPSDIRNLRPLSCYILDNGNIAKIGNSYFRVAYNPHLSDADKRFPLISLSRVHHDGYSYLAWRQVYLVRGDGHLAMGQGWSADWIPWVVVWAVGVIAVVLPLLVYWRNLLHRLKRT